MISYVVFVKCIPVKTGRSQGTRYNRTSNYDPRDNCGTEMAV